MQTFNDAAEAEGRPEDTFRTVPFRLRDARRNRGLIRPVRRFPFVPNRRERLDEDCYEAFNIQVDALMRSEERRVGKECVVRVDFGGRRIIKKKKKKNTKYNK